MYIIEGYWKGGDGLLGLGAGEEAANWSATKPSMIKALKFEQEIKRVYYINVKMK